jgi:NAD(P)H dehydrogenase (quinone)
LVSVWGAVAEFERAIIPERHREGEGARFGQVQGPQAGQVSRQSGKTIAYNDLSQGAYEGVLTGAGLPADLAAILADADVAASGGALLDESHQLSRLIGRATTPMESVVAAILRG